MNFNVNRYSLIRLDSIDTWAEDLLFDFYFPNGHVPVRRESGFDRLTFILCRITDYPMEFAI